MAVKDLKLAYLGPTNTFSHKAAKACNEEGHKFTYVSKEGFKDIVASVVSGDVDRGIIPFFNPYEEHIRECQQMLFDDNLIATDVQKVDIAHYFISNAANLSDIKAVISNQHVFKQCDIWLQKNLPNIERIEVSSTAKAALIAQDKPHAAAICSHEAAIMNPMNIFFKNIHNPDNFTLFFVIAKGSPSIDWKEYSFFCFKLDYIKEKMEILDILKKHNLICSQQWDFPHQDESHRLFFVEFFGRFSDLNTIAFIRDVKKSFPEGRFVGTFSQSITKLLQQI